MHGYVDIIGTVHLLVDDVARGFGFVMVRKERVTKRGDKSPKTCDTVTESCDNYYTAIRWNTVNKYLRDCDCLGKDDPDVKSGDYIPEQWFYLLAMKANNERAKKFQYKVAYEIMPALRKHGYYSLVPSAASVVEILEYRIYLFLLSDGTVKIGLSKRFIARAGEVERETGLKIVDVYFTPKMSYENAHLIEWCVKKNLAPNHVKGEIYSVALAKARVTITHYMQMTFVTLPTESVKRIADKQD